MIRYRLLAALAALVHLCAQAQGELLPCEGSDIPVLQERTDLEFSLMEGQQFCTSTRDCQGYRIRRGVIVYWVFMPPGNVTGNYTVTGFEGLLDKFSVCVHNGGLVVVRNKQATIDPGRFTVIYKATNGTQITFDVSYAPHGFERSREDNFVVQDMSGIEDVWRSSGVCSPAVKLCEVVNGTLANASNLFEPAFRSEGCDVMFRFGLLVTREVVPEDDGNHELVLVEGAANGNDVDEGVCDSAVENQLESPRVTVFVDAPGVTTMTPEPTGTTDQPGSSSGGDDVIVIVVAIVISLVSLTLVGILVVVVLIWWRRGKNKGANRRVEEPDGFDVPPRSPSVNNYEAVYKQGGTIELSQTQSLDDKVKTDQDLWSTLPEQPISDIRTIAVVTDQEGQWDQDLGDKLVERHVGSCKRKEVHLEQHKDDRQTYIFGILSEKEFEWMYIVWCGSLEKLREAKDWRRNLWDLVSELKSVCIPEELRKKVVLVQLEANSTAIYENGVISVYIGRQADDSMYTEQQAALDIYKQMENKDRERKTARERQIPQPAPNANVHPPPLRVTQLRPHKQPSSVPMLRKAMHEDPQPLGEGVVAVSIGAIPTHNGSFVSAETQVLQELLNEVRKGNALKEKELELLRKAGYTQEKIYAVQKEGFKGVGKKLDEVVDLKHDEVDQAQKEQFESDDDSESHPQ